MKRNDFILIISAAAYSLLFYEQQRGVNFLLFTCLLMALLLIRNIKLIREPSWIAAATGSLISGAAVFIFGNQLSFITNIISLSLLSAFSVNASTSLIVALINSLFSYVSAIVMILIDWIENKKETIKSNHPLSVRLFLFIIPLAVVLIFFGLYKSSNPLFENFTQNINLDFISWSWVRFTLIGFIFMYAFFHHRVVATITVYDAGRIDQLTSETVSYKPFFGNGFQATHEQLSGTVLFALLNILLCIVNALDVRYLWLGGQLPVGMNYSESVHQGIGALIASIIFAEIIILFYFRGVLNFIVNNTLIKSLSYIWILQNILMIVSTAYRNLLYVNEYSLTYKRIGVFVYLLLCISGLIITFVKISRTKSNWFLFRKNGWIFYVSLVFASVFNWDVFITNTNIEQAEKSSKSVDKSYLLSMIPNNIPQLIRMDTSLQHKDLSDESASSSSSVLRSDSYDEYVSAAEISNDAFKNTLSKSIYDFSASKQKQSWQSYCYERQQIYDGISRLNAENKIDALDLSNGSYNSLKPIEHIGNITQLNFNNNLKFDLSELKPFAKLTQLELNNCHLDTLDRLPPLSHLEELDLSNNEVIHLQNLNQYSEIKSLDLIKCSLRSIDDLPDFEKLEQLNLSLNNINSFAKLGMLKNLKDLNLYAASANASLSFSPMPTLESLNLGSNELNLRSHNLLSVLVQMKNLTSLNLSNNSLDNLRNILVNSISEDLPPIEVLSISNNRFDNWNEVNFLSGLKVLEAEQNYFASLYGCEKLQSLQSLNISENKSLVSIEALSSCKNLVSLDLHDDARIRNFNSLLNLTQIENLNLAGTAFPDIKLLHLLKQLKVLDLSNSSVSQLTGIEQLTVLEELNLENCSIGDYTALLCMKQLKTLRLNDNLPEAIYRKLMVALPATKIYPQRYFNSND